VSPLQGQPQDRNAGSCSCRRCFVPPDGVGRRHHAETDRAVPPGVVRIGTAWLELGPPPASAGKRISPRLPKRRN
jgi:hypothetical protein